MKKTLLFGLCACMGFFAQAQGIYQFSDPGFENWDSEKEPGKGWTSFNSARTSDLAGFLANIAKSQSPNPSKTDGHNSTTAVLLKSASAFGVKANGNLTTGQINMGSTSPADAKNYNFTNTADESHHVVFAGTPDAVGFYAKFKSGGSPNGRGQFILHDECEYRDPELDSQAANRVGRATVLVTECSEWTYFEGAFEYDRTTKPEKQYLLGSFTTNPTPGGSTGDELIIDDVQFIYYHALENVGYNGTAVTFDANNSCDLGSEVYDATKSLTYTKKGVGATVETAYDEATGVLTLTVKGNDYAVNAASVTTYRVQFALPVTGEPLGEKLLSLDNIDVTKTYVLYNETFTTYAIYKEAAGDNLWAAGMKSGDASHTVSNADYSRPVDLTDAGSSWMIYKQEGSYYLYNMGAKKYLKTPGGSGSCTFSAEPVALKTVDLGDGKFAFSSTDNELDFMCAAPQLNTPVSIWTSDDSGSAWQLIVNPNIEADASILPAPVPNTEIAGIVVNGENLYAEGQTEFAITGNYDADQFVVTLPEGSTAEMSDIAYDRFNRVATFTVEDGDETTTYTVTFGLPTLERDAVYQLPNAGFDEAWIHENEPGYGWNSFPSACGPLSILNSMSNPNLIKGEGYESDNAAVLSSKNLWIANANGNLTTGIINMGSATPTDAANFNFTDRGDANHSVLFAGRPDAVSFRAKFKSGGSPNGRGQFILHGDVNYCDPEIESQAEYKVGIAAVAVPETEEWTLFSGEFEYLQDQPATQYMLASFTTNPLPGGSAGDSLWVDDVNLIYYHSLTALAYEGADIAFDENTLAYEVTGLDYDAAKLSFTKKGVGATVETAYDEVAEKLTITVKGNDYAVNPESVTVYEVAFLQTPTGIGTAAVADKNADIYTVSGVKVSATGQLPAGVYIVNGKKTVIGR